MILVTGAAGKTGQAIIRALLKREKTVRALVHKDDQIERLQKLGVQEVSAGDMGCQESMHQVFRGIKPSIISVRMPALRKSSLVGA